MVRRLGAGGMGEVFLAQDTELDRLVAIKRIRPDKHANAQRSARFQREARLAARLNHPAIVQVFHVIRDHEVDCMVMEYVAGTTLKKSLAGHPVELVRGLQIARRIAEGMIVAHEAGIVHRDLKTENILVSESGEVKITDFGVAKQSGTGGVTADGAVLGTCRAMSPEQALGKSVDIRSDLFSFGVLMYELFTGRSPFLADNDLATIQRVIGEPHEPASDVAADLPLPLTQLIDQLLAKQPALRPRGFVEVERELSRIAANSEIQGETTGSLVFESPLGALDDPRIEPIPTDDANTDPEPEEPSDPDATAMPISAAQVPSQRHAGRARAGVALALCAAVAVGAWLWHSRSLPSRPAVTGASSPDDAGVGSSDLPTATYVAVLPPESENSGLDEPTTAILVASIRQSLTRALTRLQGVAVHSASEVDGAFPARAAGAPGDTPTARQPLTQIARALDADVLLQSSLACRPQRCNITLSRLRADGSVAWTRSFLANPSELRTMRNAVIANVRNGFSEFRPRPGTSELQIDEAEYRAFLEAHTASLQGQRAAVTIETLAEIRQRAPDFLEVYILEAGLAKNLYALSHRKADLERARRLARTAQNMAPDQPDVLELMARVARESDDREATIAAVDRLERLSPGLVTVPLYRAWLVVDQDIDQAMALIDEALQRSSSWGVLRESAELEYRYGRIERARRHLQQLLEQAPGNPQGLVLLGRLELMNGDPARAVTTYRELVTITPDFGTYSNLGTAEILLERYDDAVTSLDKARALQPDNAIAVFNLADAAKLAGRREEAASHYRQVLAILDANPDAAKLDSAILRAQSLAHLGREIEAVNAIQDALRLAPRETQVHYSAAVVYALLGDAASARARAIDALEGGYAPRWFRFPWFDIIRRDPTFRERLDRPPRP